MGFDSQSSGASQHGGCGLGAGWAVLARMRAAGVAPDVDTYTQLLLVRTVSRLL